MQGSKPQSLARAVGCRGAERLAVARIILDEICLEIVEVADVRRETAWDGHFRKQRLGTMVGDGVDIGGGLIFRRPVATQEAMILDDAVLPEGA